LNLVFIIPILLPRAFETLISSVLVTNEDEIGYKRGRGLVLFIK